MKLTGLLLILFGLLAGYVLKESGVFRKVVPHFDGKSEVFNAPPGVEDMTLDRGTGKLYLSSLNRRDSTLSGDLYVTDITADTLSFVNLTGGLDNFRPHGISLLNKYDRKFLFVISHRKEEHVVERFEITGDSLIDRHVFKSSLFISPNDILAVDTNTFYVTNDHGLKPGLERTVKEFIIDPNGFVVLVKDGQAKRASEKLAYANGINLSPDGQFVYVAATTAGKIYVYKRDIQTQELSLEDIHDTQTGVDNIEIDQFGNLILGAHPQMLKFLSHAKDSQSKSPSQILKVVYLPDTDYKFLQEELYLNDGTPLSGSSVGVYFQKENGQNDLFVGSVFESKVLRLHRNL